MATKHCTGQRGLTCRIKIYPDCVSVEIEKTILRTLLRLPKKQRQGLVQDVLPVGFLVVE